ERNKDKLPSANTQNAISRRKFVAGVGAITGFAVGAPALAATMQEVAKEEALVPAASAIPLEIPINGTVHRLSLDPRVTLLESLVHLEPDMDDVGKIMNQKTARSQFIGGIVWGLSLALFEDTQLDERYGRFVNGTLEKY